MELKKCNNSECDGKKEEKYTLKEKCPKCGKKTASPHYKHVKINDAPKN